MKKRKKRAALQYVALFYFSLLGLTLGMLRCAQKTRQALYGGQPAMAQITENTDVPNSYEISLGGGEWIYELAFPSEFPTEKLAQTLTPCLAKWAFSLYSAVRNAII